jgi:hypothetical protein
MHEHYKSEQEKILEERLIQIIEKFLDLKQWEFKLSYKSYKNSYVVIYDSPSCRLLCSLSHDPRDKKDSIAFNYGRSHAPNDNHYMVYRGENCHAWHSFTKDYIGQFLDGVKPRTLARARMGRINIPSRAREAFDRSKTNEELSGPIWGLQLTAFTWGYYGNSLFNLFDLSYPERWEKYRYFLSEFYDELSKEPTWKELFVDKPEWKPFPWQVC